MLTDWKLNKYPLLFILGSLAFYISFAFDLDRTDFVKLLGLYLGLFFLYYRLVNIGKTNIKVLVGAGILFRLVFLIVTPNLSQDFYRFIWDGQLILNGINPYIHTPDFLMTQADFAIPNAQEMYQGMGSLSAKHFSNYPPVNQLLFTVAAFFGGKSLWVSTIALRCIIILGDIGILYFGKKLLDHLKKPSHLIFWFFLNPLVIIELSGNLHFEGVMLFFFIWAMYLIRINKWYWAAPIYSFSILLKLVPLLFLPLFLTHFGLKKSIGFYGLIGITSILVFLPFYSPEFAGNYAETVGLWFSNFEFNAGLYNLIKTIAVNFYDAKPWELVKDYGKIVPIAVILFTLALTFIRKNTKMETLLGSMLWILTFYYFLSSTVHPWYLVFIVLLCIYTSYRFALIWSISAILSYFAYSQADYSENLWLLLIEYSVAFGLLIYELKGNRGSQLRFFKN